MEIRNSVRWTKAGPEAYYVGFAGFSLAFVLRDFLHPVLENHLPILFFAVNSLAIAYYYGFAPSFLMLLLSFPVALYFFVYPYNSFSVFEPRDFYILVVNFTLVGLASYMFELLRREQYKSTLLARVSDTRYRLLVEADEDRRAILRSAPKPD